jgi:hypothetical protein
LYDDTKHTQATSDEIQYSVYDAGHGVPQQPSDNDDYGIPLEMRTGFDAMAPAPPETSVQVNSQVSTVSTAGGSNANNAGTYVDSRHNGGENGMYYDADPITDQPPSSNAGAGVGTGAASDVLYAPSGGNTATDLTGRGNINEGAGASPPRNNHYDAGVPRYTSPAAESVAEVVAHVVVQDFC